MNDHPSTIKVNGLNPMARDFVTLNPKEDRLHVAHANVAPKTPEPYESSQALRRKLAQNDRKPTLNDATADFTIICNGKRFVAHKSVLTTKCPYFERLFRFKGKEVSDDEVEIKDMNRYLMKWVLDFIYNGKYTLPGGTIVPSTGYCIHMLAAVRSGPPSASRIFKVKCAAAGKDLRPSHLLPHTRLYALADYFDMPDFKAFARQGVMDVLHVYWGDEELNMADALEEAFSSTPDVDRGLRQVMIDIMKAHPGVWVDDGAVAFWLNDHPDVLEEVDCD